MIYLSLFIEFLKIGLFSFGGAYGAIPLIQETVKANGWMDEAAFSNLIAISESTPGPIMVNAATYIGNCQAGAIGAIAATSGVVLPSFFIVLLITALFPKMTKNKNVKMALKGIKPCLMGVVLATGLYMVCSTVLLSKISLDIDYASLIILTLLIIISFAFYKKKNKTISPISLIVVAAVMGCILY